MTELVDTHGMVIGRQKGSYCEGTEKSRPWLKSNGSSNMMTYWIDDPSPDVLLHLHDLDVGVVSTDGNKGHNVGGGETQCYFLDNGHWMTVWNPNPQSGRCGLNINVSVRTHHTQNTPVRSLATGTMPNSPCWDRDCDRRHSSCSSQGCKADSQPNCLKLLPV